MIFTLSGKSIPHAANLVDFSRRAGLANFMSRGGGVSFSQNAAMEDLLLLLNGQSTYPLVNKHSY